MNTEDFFDFIYQTRGQISDSGPNGTSSISNSIGQTLNYILGNVIGSFKPGEPFFYS